MLISFASPSFAQIRKIPAEVTEALKSKYPEAKNVSWSDKLTMFVASFDINNEHYKANFSSKGEWQKTQKELTESNLPATIKDGFAKSKYADWTFKSAHLLNLPGDTTQYVIIVAKGKVQKKNLLFSDKGQLLKDNYTL
jgi:hypothetical protein